MLGVLYQRPSTARPRADRWTRRVDGASLGVFRIAFGLVGLLSVVRLVDRGWATTRYAGPTHRFTYLGFGWVPKPSPAGMLVLLAVVGVAAALVTVGWHYRPAHRDLLRRVHLDRAHRRHDLPEPLRRS